MLPFVFSSTQKEIIYKRNDRGKENFKVKPSG